MMANTDNKKKKLAVIFPGVGYNKDRPLLYYAGKQAVARGYELVQLSFTGLDWSKEKLKDRDFLLDALDKCLKMTEEQLKGCEDLSQCEVVFISKSIGTVVAAAYERKNDLTVKQICFSPLAIIGNHVRKNGAVLFYGDNDPFADYRDIEKIATEKDLEKVRIEGGNHSLETGDVIRDIRNLEMIIQHVDESLQK